MSIRQNIKCLNFVFEICYKNFVVRFSYQLYLTRLIVKMPAKSKPAATSKYIEVDLDQTIRSSVEKNSKVQAKVQPKAKAKAKPKVQPKSKSKSKPKPKSKSKSKPKTRSPPSDTESDNEEDEEEEEEENESSGDEGEDEDEDDENEDEDADADVSSDIEDENNTSDVPDIPENARIKLKTMLMDWLDYDDKIKLLAAKSKEFKTEKKNIEEYVIQKLTKLGFNDQKVNIHDKNGEIRSSVYKYKTTTKSPLKMENVEAILMQVLGNERKTIQCLKKIDDSRDLVERVYLKRTKGRQT